MSAARRTRKRSNAARSTSAKSFSAPTQDKDAAGAAAGDSAPNIAGFTAAALWPDRTQLYVSEVARVFSVSEDHIANLIHQGQLGAFDIKTRSRALRTLRKARRGNLRVTPQDFDSFVEARRT